MHDHIDSRAAAGVQKRRPVEERIGFIGLGRMGAAMATNLVQAGCDVRAYVRRPERIKELAALGLDTTAEVADLFDCEIVVSMLPDDKAVRDVMFGLEPRPGNGLASGLMPGAIHLSMSTISTAASSAIDSGHAKLDQGYVAAPVFGNPDAAAARQLYIVAAGSGYYIERCQPIFDILGQRTFVVGPEPATANLIKLAGNALTAATLEMLGEVVEILTETMYGSRVHKIYGGKIVAQHYEPGFVLPLALKDVRLALAEAEAAGVPMPSVRIARDRLMAGIARGYAGLDWSALGRVAADEAGLT
ncbi:MAG: NAD(P)-dependent oxidoreductase [Alphaproteobacteria bacterium]|nr:MAG: NAD(P)-dependent oxidoreductase [Alphaproteobacteria bacterium]